MDESTIDVHLYRSVRKFWEDAFVKYQIEDYRYCYDRYGDGYWDTSLWVEYKDGSHVSLGPMDEPVSRISQQNVDWAFYDSTADIYILNYDKVSDWILQPYEEAGCRFNFIEE